VVTEKTTGPISETFSRYLKEVGLGRSRREALMGVARQTGVVDLIRFAASVEQAEELGTSLWGCAKAAGGRDAGHASASGPGGS